MPCVYSPIFYTIFFPCTFIAALSEQSSCLARCYSEASAQTGLALLDQSPTTALSAYLNAHAVIRQTPLTTTLQPVHSVP